jgi:hypothetical protein
MDLKKNSPGKKQDNTKSKKSRVSAKDNQADKKLNKANESQKAIDVDPIRSQNRAPQQIAEDYKRGRKMIEEKRKEIGQLLDNQDMKQERNMKRRAKLQEILAELERDLNVRMGKETVKSENDQKMQDKHKEITDLIEAIPEKTKSKMDSEIEDFSKVFNTEIQKMRKEIIASSANKLEYDCCLLVLINSEESTVKKQEDLQIQLGLMYKATEKIDRENTKLTSENKQYDEDYKKQEQNRLKLFQYFLLSKLANSC